MIVFKLFLVFFQPWHEYHLTAPPRRGTDVYRPGKWFAWCLCRRCPGWGSPSRREPRSTTSAARAREPPRPVSAGRACTGSSTRTEWPPCIPRPYDRRTPRIPPSRTRTDCTTRRVRPPPWASTRTQGGTVCPPRTKSPCESLNVSWYVNIIVAIEHLSKSSFRECLINFYLLTFPQFSMTFSMLLFCFGQENVLLLCENTQTIC